MDNSVDNSWRWVSYTDPLWSWPCYPREPDRDDMDLDDDALNSTCFKVQVRAAIDRAWSDFPDAPQIWLADQLRKATDDVLAELVAESRAEGMSWTLIGDALGVGRTAAQKRFGRGLSRRHQRILDKEVGELIEHCRRLLGKSEGDEETRQDARETLELLKQRRGGADHLNRR